MRRKIITLIEFVKLIENPSPDLKIPVYDESKEEESTTMHPTRKKKSKYTLNQLGVTVDKLVITVNDLAKEMRDGFKQVNTRIDKIEDRLDYNNLKKLPENR